MVDLPELRDLAELRELVALRDQRAAHTDHGIGPNPGSAEEAKATGLRALPYRAALAALDLILSAASRGQAILPGVSVVDHPGGFAVTGVMRRAIHETLAGVETVTAISSTLQPETLAPWFSRVDVEGAWEPLEDDPLERTQVLAGTATSSVVDQGGALTDLGEKIAEKIDALRLVEERPILIASVGDWPIYVGRAGRVVPLVIARRRPSSHEDAIVPSRHGLICGALAARVVSPSPGSHPHPEADR